MKTTPTHCSGAGSDGPRVSGAPKRTCGRRGSALILVLWALMLLSAAVMAWSLAIQDNIIRHATDNRAFEAMAMARSGLAIALHPAVSRQTPVPPEDLAPGMGFQVRIISEGGKLNLNWLLRGEEPLKLEILRKWLEQRGLKYQDREVFIDCLLDYVDADNIKRLNGAEDDGDYHPANRELQSVDELVRVRGTAPLTSQPGWQDDLTVYSMGPIDLDSASEQVLSLIPGLNAGRIQQFVKLRQGPDGIDGTPDDYIFPNVTAIQQFLGLTPAQFQAISGLVTYKDPTLRIISVGHSSDVTRQIAVVARKGTGSKPQILAWKE
jgi:type II secretory pathway component PulK